MLINMKRAVRRIFRESGFKSISILISGTMSAQIISFACQPIITRLYSPEEFGKLGVILSIVNMLAPLITLQYHMGIITAKSNKEAKVVSALSLYLILIMSILITIALSVYNILFPSVFIDLGYWIYIVIPLLMLTGIINVLDSYNNRFEQYKLMASISLLRSIVLNTLKILLGIFKLGFVGLLVSQFISKVAGIKRQAKYLVNNLNEIINTPFKELKKGLVKFKVQPLFSMPGLFVTTFSFSILTILVDSLYTVDQAGYFYFSMSLMGIPLTLISSNVARIFFRKATLEKEKKGNFLLTFKSTFIILFTISLIGFSILWFTVEPIFSFVFGERWIRSGTFVKILIPMFAIRFVVTGLMHGFIVSGKQLLKLIIQILFIVVAISSYFITKYFVLPIEVFLSIINVGYFIIYVILLLILYFTSRKSDT